MDSYSNRSLIEAICARRENFDDAGCRNCPSRPNQISRASRFSTLPTCDPANDDSPPELDLWIHHQAVVKAPLQHLPKPATARAKAGESCVRRGFPGSCWRSSAVRKQTHLGMR